MAVGAVLMLGSCADDLTKEIKVDKPDSVTEEEKYRGLASLKEGKGGNDVMLSVALPASDLINVGVAQALTVSNFDDVATSDAMVHSACVNNDGVLNFDKATQFVKAAKKYELSVFGQALLGSDNVNAKYLNSLIAPKEKQPEPKPVVNLGDFVTNGNVEDEDISAWSNNWQGPEFSRVTVVTGACIKYTIGEAGSNQWDKQGIYTLPVPMEQDKDYVVKMKVRASAPVADEIFGLWPIWSTSENLNEWGASNDVQYLASYAVTSEWKEYTWEFKALFPHDKLQFVFGALGGEVFFDDLTVKLKGSDEEMVVNGSFDAESIEGWSNNWQGPEYARAIDKNSYLEYKCGEAGKDSWDKQAIYTMGRSMDKGVKHTVKVRVKADNPGKVSLVPIFSTSENKNEWGGSDDVQYLDAFDVDSEWKVLTWNFTANFPHDKLQFFFGQQSGNIYFDDLTVEAEETKPAEDDKPVYEELSDKVKKDTLSLALNQWIEGLFTAAAGYVTVWDVVSEPICNGEKVANGFYALRHGAKDGKDFFWQDYLGDEHFVRLAEYYARKSFSGEKSALKFFVNEKGLEKDPKKVNALLHWIGAWENDTTKIDGISVQLHIDADATSSDEVQSMLSTLAGSGKLIRISALDVTGVDDDDVAAMYKSVVQAYLSAVPAAQRYGICLTSLKVNSLWTDEYMRNSSYKAFLEALSGN